VTSLAMGWPFFGLGPRRPGGTGDANKRTSSFCEPAEDFAARLPSWSGDL